MKTQDTHQVPRGPSPRTRWITRGEVRGLESSKLRSPLPTPALSRQAGSDRWDGVWGGRGDTRQGEHPAGMNEVTGSEPAGRPSTPHRTLGPTQRLALLEC